MRSTLYIGLMSGTSLDGVDGVLVDLAQVDAGCLQVKAHAHQAFSPELAGELLALNSAGPNELHRAALAANALVRVYAAVVKRLLAAAGVRPQEVSAIGAHGQTVRHCPGEFDGLGYTLQLNQPALLAEACGIDVVADFRSRDIAAGGQGAPLVPAFHRALFGRPDQTLAVLNIGGMSNLTVLAADGSTTGFDCGPGNALMDGWCLRHQGSAFDRDGQWAASGQVLPGLLERLQADPYFAKLPPKSTGRDRFHLKWLDQHIAGLHAGASVPPADVQATLTELTAWACTQDLKRHAQDARDVLVCGGGSHNLHLMRGLRQQLPRSRVDTTDRVGLPADQVEATAFAWLGRACVLRQPGSLARVTGANGPRVLGAVYPAG